MVALPAANAILTEHLDTIERALRSAIGPEGGAIAAAARYVLGWEDERGETTDATGKRIRPALCLFAAGAAGGSVTEAIPGAVAVELVHNFSLVHDEVQDHDAERHHRPTLWARMGEGQAINVGDFLFTRATRALTEGPGDPLRRMRSLAVLGDAIERMIRGQWDDIDFESRESVSIEEYLAMVAGKTGALLSAPLEIGAILAGAAPEVSAAFGRWGLHVGAAFQAQDDYLGIWGDPGETGKSNTNDIARRKKTLPIVHGLADATAGPVIRRIYAHDTVSPPDVAAVVAALDAAGSGQFCRARAVAQSAAADALLSELGLEVAMLERFRAIARYLGERAA